MAGISDFITMASSKLGISSDAAQAGTGGLLELVKKHAGTSLFGEVSKAMPDASTVAEAAPAPVAAATEAHGVGGMLGGLAKKAGGLLGGSGGEALNVVSMLQGAGISAEKAPRFVSMFIDFLKSKLSPDLANKLLAKVGDLKKVAGV